MSLVEKFDTTDGKGRGLRVTEKVRRTNGDGLDPVRLRFGYAQRRRCVSLLPSVRRSNDAQILRQMQICQILQRRVPEKCVGRPQTGVRSFGEDQPQSPIGGGSFGRKDSVQALSEAERWG